MKNIEYIISVENIEKIVDKYYKMVRQEYNKIDGASAASHYNIGFINGIKYATSILKINLLESLYSFSSDADECVEVSYAYKNVLDKIERIERFGEAD